MSSVHTAVLLHEVVNGLGLARNNKTLWYLDGTIGGSHHALAIAEALKFKVNIIGLDRDPSAIKRAAEILEGKAEKIILECQDFRHLDKSLDRNGITGVDYILFDLGISSDELENSGKGFSFLKDEPLLMTMGDPTNYTFTAKDIVNSWSEEDIANVIFAYGEERFARRIARKIVSYRDKKSIETSAELAEIISLAIPTPIRFKHHRIHPATRTFQALRIAVNDELSALKQGLVVGYERLNVGGRMAVISFHSLEDRIVKNFYRFLADRGAEILTKKPKIASAEETRENPRARSAKLRAIQKR